MSKGRNVRVGGGDFIYDFIPDWGKLPEGYDFGGVPDGAVDAEGNVYVFSRSDHPIMVFDSDGNFIRSWGEKIFRRPHGAYISSDAFYCVDDFQHTVRKCTLAGEVLMMLGTPDMASDTGYDGKDWRTIKHPGPPFNRPTSLALAPTGEMYISDGYGNCRVHKFSPDGKLLFSWGEPGLGPGQFSIVHTVRVDSQGTVYVSDRESDRIQLFTPDGEYITSWTDFHRPCGMFFDADDNLYVGEMQTNATPTRPANPAQISIYSRQGQRLARWGDFDIWKDGNIFAPHGIWGDPHGNIYIGELTSDSQSGNKPAGYPCIHKLIRVRR